MTIFGLFLNNFCVYPNCKRSSLRSQCWMRLFGRFSTTVLFTFEKLSFMSKTCWDILYFFCNLHQLATSPLQKVQGFFWPLALNRRRPTIIFLLEAHVRVSREPSPLTDYYWTWKEKKILSSSTLTSLLSIPYLLENNPHSNLIRTRM